MQSIGPYRIVERVAEGGLSTVYAAVDPRNGRRVAVKVAHTGVDSRDVVVDRFRQESRLSAAIDHPAIAKIFDFGMLPDGSPYVVSDWVEGRSLDHLLRSHRRLKLAVALSIAEQVAGGLGAAHSLDFVHADVKPANILVENENLTNPLAVKLLDFGVAGRLGKDTHLTLAGVLIGTPYYMSPEQIRAEGLSPSTDIWALGVVLFEMLTGRRPFEERSTIALISAIMTAKVSIPEDASLPPPVAAFLLRCLDRDPKLRPANGTEAEKEIQKLRAALTLPTQVDTAELFPEPPLPVAPAFPAEFTGFSTPEERHKKAPAATRVLGELPSHPHRTPKIRARTAELAPAAGLPLFIAATTGIALCGALFILLRFPRFAPRPWAGVLLGVVLALAGTVLGRGLQKALATRHRQISAEMHEVLNGARTQRRFSQTLAVQVDELVAKVHLVDERILATTIAVMVEEFSTARAFDDRQKALMNAVTLLEKLMPRLSPWYVRHDKLIGFVVTLVGILSGLVTVAQNFEKLIKG